MLHTQIVLGQHWDQQEGEREARGRNVGHEDVDSRRLRASIASSPSPITERIMRDGPRESCQQTDSNLQYWICSRSCAQYSVYKRAFSYQGGKGFSDNCLEVASWLNLGALHLLYFISSPRAPSPTAAVPRHPMPYQPSRLIRAVEYGTDWSQRISHPIRAFPNRSIEDLLARPTWSVRSLLPDSESAPSDTQSKAATTTSTDSKEKPPPQQPLEQEVTREKLHHLLRLSALPLPKTPAEESKLLSSLRSQIHFVRAIQSVDTSHVTPLVAIRDETPDAIAEQTVHVADLQQWLDLEEKVGENGTLRRKKVEKESGEGKIGEGEKWDPFQLGSGCEEGSGRRMGRWFVVKKAKPTKEKPTKDDGSIKKSRDGVEGVEADAG